MRNNSTLQCQHATACTLHASNQQCAGNTCPSTTAGMSRGRACSCAARAICASDICDVPTVMCNDNAVLKTCDHAKLQAIRWAMAGHQRCCWRPYASHRAQSIPQCKFGTRQDNSAYTCTCGMHAIVFESVSTSTQPDRCSFTHCRGTCFTCACVQHCQVSKFPMCRCGGAEQLICQPSYELHCVERRTSQQCLVAIVYCAARGQNVPESGACTRWVQRRLLVIGSANAGPPLGHEHGSSSLSISCGQTWRSQDMPMRQ